MSSYATTDLGDTVAFDLRGTGPAVVFVAGAGPHRAVDPATTRTAELAAARGLTTVVPDRLGRGESVASGHLGLQRELAMLRTAIDAAGGRAVLVGHSSGCAISLAAAAAGLPVDGLVLWEAPMDMDEDDVRAWIGEFERRLDDGDLDGALAQYMKDMPPEWLEGARQDPSYPQIVADVVSYRADGEALVWAGSAPYAELSMPVLTLVGEHTFPGMTETATAIAAALPSGRTATAPGRDHEWEPEPMADLLVEFVRDLHGQPAARRTS
ncbi:alpha/beta hydrolase [Aeromicrobium phragmitis]|uniref:Alpha/beta hydrolase n=1 Tax=Aeromicrobium phragmitis TaxID=2478914 RepID=A0A3L8PSZ4_9ACTN|nr:alpha/beta hydrolase [Aeromicrobium phragmitis]RLV57112.1 alpha/beta hydrolase [Aeromicrobium phragmitis]